MDTSLAWLYDSRSDTYSSSMARARPSFSAVDASVAWRNDSRSDAISSSALPNDSRYDALSFSRSRTRASCLAVDASLAWLDDSLWLDDSRSETISSSRTRLRACTSSRDSRLRTRASNSPSAGLACETARPRTIMRRNATKDADSVYWHVPFRPCSSWRLRVLADEAQAEEWTFRRARREIYDHYREKTRVARSRTRGEPRAFSIRVRAKHCLRTDDAT